MSKKTESTAPASANATATTANNELTLANSTFHSAMVALGVSNALSLNADIKLHSKNDDGALSIHLDNQEVALVASSIQSIARIGAKLSAGMSVALAMMERESTYKTMKFKTAIECAIALTGLDKSTLQAYLNVGKTFFDKNGLPIKPFVLSISNAHLNQLQGKLRKNLVVYGADVNLDFFENVFDTVPNMTVSALRELLTALENGAIPDSFVSYSQDGATAYLSGPNEIILKGYEKPSATDIAPNTAPSKPTDKDGGKATNTTTEGDGKTESAPNTFESRLVPLSTALDGMAAYISQFDSDADKSLSNAFKAYVNEVLARISDFEVATHDATMRESLTK